MGFTTYPVAALAAPAGAVQAEEAIRAALASVGTSRGVMDPVLVEGGADGVFPRIGVISASAKPEDDDDDTPSGVTERRQR